MKTKEEDEQAKAMGKKNLLRTINITDSTSEFYRSSYPGDTDATTDFNKVDIITTVYDSDEDVIECFPISFESITNDAIGFGGDYYNDDYINNIQKTIDLTDYDSNINVEFVTVSQSRS